MWVFPLTAAAVSGVFCALLLRSWRARPRPHALAWGVALAMFALASGAAAYGQLQGWSPAAFRTYYLFGAILNVPVLAVGTVYLLGPRALAHALAALTVVAGSWATVVVLGTDISSGALDIGGIPAARDVVSDDVRTISRIYSYAGFAIVAGGAILSAARASRSGEERLKTLAVGNGLIALGSAIVAAAGAFARYGRGSIFAVGLAAGVSVMFLGFLRARPRAAP